MPSTRYVICTAHTKTGVVCIRTLIFRVMNVRQDNVRLAAINTRLGVTDPLFAPQHDNAEWPEKRMEFSDEV